MGNYRYTFYLELRLKCIIPHVNVFCSNNEDIEHHFFSQMNYFLCSQGEVLLNQTSTFKFCI